MTTLPSNKRRDAKYGGVRAETPCDYSIIGWYCTLPLGHYSWHRLHRLETT